MWFILALVVTILNSNPVALSKSVTHFSSEAECQMALPGIMRAFKAKLDKDGLTVADAKCVSQDEYDAADPKNGGKI